MASFLAAVTCAAGCTGSESSSATTGNASPSSTAPLVRMDFSRASDFYAAPFPSEHRRSAAGKVDLTGFPNPDGIQLVDTIVDLVASSAGGFGATSGVFFSLTGPVDKGRLPDLVGSTSPDARVFLMDVDPASPEARERRPIKTRFTEEGGPFGAPNLLGLLPYQGLPLRPDTMYAAVVLRSLTDPAGELLGVPRSLSSLLAGGTPEGMSKSAVAAYRSAIEQLKAAGVDPNAMAGLAVFRTGSPTSEFQTVLNHATSGKLPQPAAPLTLSETHDDYCVFETTIEMPTYQSGTPPYLTEGGGWTFDANGEPQVQGMEVAGLMVTLPRRPMPAGGFPVVLTSRAGIDDQSIPRPLVDKGPRPKPRVAAIPGTGPALTFAKAGFAGLMIDGPHTGLRNITHGQAQFLIFNIQNPRALRDNVRQSAMEIALQAHILKNIQIDVSGCPGLTTGGGPARLDQGKIAGFGLSMGATILPLSMAFEPLLRAGIITGAGSSYIDNVLYKKKPIETKGLAEALLHYSSQGLELTELDPILSMLQWGAEPADPPSYNRRIFAAPQGAEHHMLMVEGIVDHYILPPMANATALSLGLDLAGDALDSTSKPLAAFTPFLDVAFLAGRGQKSYPAGGNAGAIDALPRTAVMVQWGEDGIEDGHLVLFQTEGPKYQMKCFLESFAKGTPVVPAPAGLSDACP